MCNLDHLTTTISWLYMTLAGSWCHRHPRGEALQHPPGGCHRGGLMGAGIATALITAGVPVLLKEINATFLQQGLDRVKGESYTQSPTVQYCTVTNSTVLYEVSACKVEDSTL